MVIGTFSRVCDRASPEVCVITHKAGERTPQIEVDPARVPSSDALDAPTDVDGWNEVGSKLAKEYWYIIRIHPVWFIWGTNRELSRGPPPCQSYIASSRSPPKTLASGRSPPKCKFHTRQGLRL